MATITVLHISTANISKIMTDEAKIIAIKYEVAYGLLIGIFRFDLGQL